MRLILLIFTLFPLLYSASSLAASHLDCARQKTEAAEKVQSRTEKRALSLDGIVCADACLKDDSNNAACYYYRGVNRGRLLETMLANPGTHIPLMVEDFKKAAAMNPGYDGAGALRALGYIYLQLPAISLWGAEYKRDFAKALSYAQKALSYAPSEPDNLKLSGEVAIANEDFKAALAYLEQALDLFKKNPASVHGDDLHKTEKLLKECRDKVEK